MITVIIRNDGEDSVTQMTYEGIWKELKDIPGSEIIISENWFDYLSKIKNKYVCFVEADCLVSPGYFVEQIKEFRINPGRKISMLTSKTAVERWNNCFYGYFIEYKFTQDVVPVRDKKSNKAYPIQVGYLPGAIIRLSMLNDALKELNVDNSWKNDLVYLSSELSLAFWRQGANGDSKKVQNGNPVYINPSVTYVTTEDYVNDIGKFELDTFDLQDKFIKESI